MFQYKSQEVTDGFDEYDNYVTRLMTRSQTTLKVLPKSFRRMMSSRVQRHNCVSFIFLPQSRDTHKSAHMYFCCQGLL